MDQMEPRCSNTKTTVTMAKGEPTSLLLFGDIGSIGTDDEADEHLFRQALRENLQTYTHADGHLIADYAFNILKSARNVTLRITAVFSDCG